MRANVWRNRYSIGGHCFSLEVEDSELHHLANAVYSADRVDCGTADIAFRLFHADEKGISKGVDSYYMSVASVEICWQCTLADFFLDVEWTLTQQTMGGCRTLIQVHV